MEKKLGKIKNEMKRKTRWASPQRQTARRAKKNKRRILCLKKGRKRILEKWKEKKKKYVSGLF